jgi:hypothetical protein
MSTTASETEIEFNVSFYVIKAGFELGIVPLVQDEKSVDKASSSFCTSLCLCGRGNNTKCTLL